MPSRSSRDLAAAFKQGRYDPAYYFHGAEDVLKEDAVRYLLDNALDPSLRDFNFDQRSAGQLEPDAVADLCNTLPMMAERRIVLVRDVEAWKRKTKARAALLEYLKDPSPQTIVILVQGSAEAAEDKELVKHAVSVEFKAPTGTEAEKWLDREARKLGIAFGPGAAEHLLKCTGTDLSALRLELGKFSALPEGTVVTEELVGDLVGVRRGETALDWRDAVLNGDAARAVTLLGPVLDQSGVSGVRLLMLLGTSLTAVGVLRAAYDRKVRGQALVKVAWDALKAARPWGLAPWNEETANLARWAERWPAPRLRRALEAALAADIALKSTTLSDERAVLADLVMTLTVGEKAAA